MRRKPSPEACPATAVTLDRVEYVQLHFAVRRARVARPEQLEGRAVLWKPAAKAGGEGLHLLGAQRVGHVCNRRAAQRVRRAQQRIGVFVAA